MSRVSTIVHLRKKARAFPNSPGVYIWRDGKRTPIYIGMAGSLKKRIASYFLQNANERVKEMVSTARSVSFTRTQSVLEAIVLEANLIKLHWPKYNVREKDNRSFVYLVIIDPPGRDGKPSGYPRPITVRGRDLQKFQPKGLEIFGPYQSFYLLRTALELVRRIFPYSTCTPNSGRACFHYQIGLCPGACIGAITPEEYKKQFKNFLLFFRGERTRLLKKLTKENPEKAIALQHVADTALLSHSDAILDSSKALASNRIEGYDVSHSFGRQPVGAMVVFENGEADPAQYRLFNIRGTGADEKSYDDLAMLKEVLERRLNHREWPLPTIIFVDGGTNQVRAVRKVLFARHLDIPVVGLAKGGLHAGSAYTSDRLLIAGGAKAPARALIASSKKLFQEVRNEAHRFSIKAGRRRTKRSLFARFETRR